MFWNTLAFSLIIALIFSLIFSALTNRRPWNNFWIFLIVLFLCLWAVGLWMPTVGPTWYGVAWLDLLLTGLVLTLLLVYAAPKQKEDYQKTEAGEVDLVAESKKEPGALRLANVFFWLFIAALIASIIAGLIRRGHLL